MKKNTLKSILAIVAGFILVFALSMGSDVAFMKAGLLRDPFHDTSSAVIILIIIYRNIYNVTGCYLVAALAPNRPMGHVLLVGIIGAVLSLAATIAMWEPATAWYSIAITLLAIPSAWAGGKLRESYLRLKRKTLRKTAKPATPEKVDKYIDSQIEESKAALEKLRRAIKASAPGAEEVISYGMPAFKYHGRMLVGFAAYKKHIGFYPWNGHTVKEFKNDLKAFKTSIGAIQFPLEKPIPVTLVKKIVKARMKENIDKKKK